MSKKSTLSLALILAVSVMVGFTVSAVAAAAASDGSAARDATGRMTAPKASDPVLEGTISFMEKDGTIVIKPATGQSQIAYLKPDTEVLRNGNKVSAGDLKIGAKVSITFGQMRNAKIINMLSD